MWSRFLTKLHYSINIVHTIAPGPCLYKITNDIYDQKISLFSLTRVMFHIVKRMLAKRFCGYRICNGEMLLDSR